MASKLRSDRLQRALTYAELHARAAGRTEIGFQDMLLGLTRMGQPQGDSYDQPRVVRALEAVGLRPDVSRARLDDFPPAGAPEEVRVSAELAWMLQQLPGSQSPDHLVFAMLYDIAAKDAMVILGVDPVKLGAELTRLMQAEGIPMPWE